MQPVGLANTRISTDYAKKISVVSFLLWLKATNPGYYVSRKAELVSIRVNVTLD